VKEGRPWLAHFALLSILILAADQASKWLAVRELVPGRSVAAIGSAVRLTLVHNRGTAFGILPNWTPSLLAAAIALSVAVLLYNRHFLGRHLLVSLALALQLGGAAGNLLDRLCKGYVVDFVDLRVWPVFNLADAAITVGVILLLWHLIRTR
jgi:signal peptidase II